MGWHLKKSPVRMTVRARSCLQRRWGGRYCVGMALLGLVDSIVVAVASILVASIVVVSMALLGLVDSNLWWHQFW